MIIAIVRDVLRSEIKGIAETLFESGINRVEVSLSDEENGFACLHELIHHFHSKMSIGVGTVTTAEQARKAKAYGAEYVITPGWDKTLVETFLEKGYDVIPGVFTPGEIMQAQSLGIERVKLFPISTLGPRYVKSVKAPFPNMSIMGVGGVTVENMQAYLKAGCDSFAIGGDLVPKNATKYHLEEIATKAQEFVRGLREGA